MKKRVYLIGGYQKARALSESLVKKGYLVTIINDNYKICHELAEIDGITVLNGDGTRAYVLDDAGIERADIAIALTRRDDDNLVICELAKKKFNVKKTVTLINDPKKIDFFYRMGVDSVICAITSITNIIEQQAFMDEMSLNIELDDGRVNVTQVPITNNSPVIGKELSELSLPNEVIIGCILRDHTNLVPTGDTQILMGDVLVVISSNKHELKAIRELTGR